MYIYSYSTCHFLYLIFYIYILFVFYFILYKCTQELHSNFVVCNTMTIKVILILILILLTL